MKEAFRRFFGRFSRRQRHAEVFGEQMSRHRCPECGGTGQSCNCSYPNGVQRCPRCGGWGWEYN